jgi:hypothetical protein
MVNVRKLILQNPEIINVTYSLEVNREKSWRSINCILLNFNDFSEISVTSNLTVFMCGLSAVGCVLATRIGAQNNMRIAFLNLYDHYPSDETVSHI